MGKNMHLKDHSEVHMEPFINKNNNNNILLSLPNHLAQVEGSNCLVGHLICTYCICIIKMKKAFEKNYSIFKRVIYAFSQVFQKLL